MNILKVEGKIIAVENGVTLDIGKEIDDISKFVVSFFEKMDILNDKITFMNLTKDENNDEYARGFHNGLEYAVSCLENRVSEFREMAKEKPISYETFRGVRREKKYLKV